jgi:uncharacterized membrane protein YjjP (DUF1212 family)
MTHAHLGTDLNPSSGAAGKPAPASTDDAFDALMRFGVLMWRAGNTAIRTQEWMEVMARKMGFEAVAAGLSLESITVSTRRPNGLTTMSMRAIAPPAVDAWRIAALEELARVSAPNVPPRAIEAKLTALESARPLHSRALIVGAIALASGSFAFLNGAGVVEMIATAIGGGGGQLFRFWSSRLQLNQYGIAALSAIVASGTYVLAATLADALGFGSTHYPIGFVASVLFLVPGFPLIGALFDLLQLQTVAAVSRLANAVMILLAAALGLSIVIAVAGVDLSRPPPITIDYPIKLLLRAVASFIAGCAFSLLFNTPTRTVFAVGFLALAANCMRLFLNDIGLTPAPAAFSAALVVGLVALLIDRNVPRMAMTVAPVVIMIPGLYAFDMIALLNQGQVLEAMQAAAVCGFVIGALAMGLATARVFSVA